MGTRDDSARRSLEGLLGSLTQTENQARAALKEALTCLPSGSLRDQIGQWLRDDDLDKMSVAEMRDLTHQVLGELPEPSSAATATAARGNTGTFKPGERPPRQRPRR